MNTITHCAEYGRLTRRGFLSNGLQSAAAMVFGRSLLTLPGWLPQIALADPHTGPRGDTLVCIFLRGGCDGLNMVVPFGDEAYYSARPNLSIGRPDQNSADSKAINLDGYFGLHPALEPLHNLYAAGDLAFVHATGAPDESRSHFVAQAMMEQGVSSDYTGWLARHLATLDTGNDSALRAVGIGDLLQLSLHGTTATVMQSAENYDLHTRPNEAELIRPMLETLYQQQQTMLASAADQTLATIDLMQQVQGANTVDTYGNTPFANALKTTAQLIHADVGVEVACVDLGGWDTHANQGAGDGQMAGLMESFSAELATFHEDLQSKMGNVTVVVMSEFGRRVHENSSNGTDHGHGNMMMLLGGNVHGSQVYADWPTLAAEQLEGKGDLAITTDYRDILGEIVRKRLNNPLTESVFPNYSVAERGLLRGA